jgi:hypothetical protein
MSEKQFYDGQVRLAHAAFKFGSWVIPTPFWIVTAILDDKELDRRIALSKFTAIHRHVPDMSLVLQTAIVHAEVEAILRHHASE